MDDAEVIAHLQEKETIIKEHLTRKYDEFSHLTRIDGGFLVFEEDSMKGMRISVIGINDKGTFSDRTIKVDLSADDYDCRW